MAKNSDKADEKFNETLRRMLKTPPKPKRSEKAEKSQGKKDKPAK